MKNSTKTGLAIIFAVIVFGGSGVISSVFAKGNNKIKNMLQRDFEIKTTEINESFTDIKLEEMDMGFYIRKADDGKCRVVSPERTDGSVYHAVEVVNDELCVIRHDSAGIFDSVSVFNVENMVEIYLPEGEYGKLTAKNGSGRIEVDEGYVFESANLKNTSGRIEMHSDVKGELTADNTSGRIKIENVNPEKLVANSTSGRVVLTNVKSDDVYAKSTSGRTVLNNVTARDIEVKATSGKIELNDVIAENKLDAENSSGGVTLNRCDAEKINIRTTSGSVKGCVLSDKIFNTKTTSGSVHLPRSVIGGECDIHTTSGSIKIEIEN
ncbi:MAG: DUF4097 family beta strand repeat-containing protein [Clostridia bacterium]|nr:DUF4097 family beta strand repeat-containing protein [Clostridia bacterium]